MYYDRVPLIATPLLDKAQTGRSMHGLVQRFAGDLGALCKLTLPQFYDLVRAIPYQRDTRGQEWTVRPGLLLKEFPEMDCKKKAILIASWAKCNGIPFRFLSVSERRDGKIHHVFSQLFINGQWLNVDATYPRYKLFQKKTGITRAEILKP